MKHDILTEKENKILKFIDESVKSNGYPPTIREICKGVGIKSPSTTHAYIIRLKEKGLITSDEDKPRTLKIKDSKYSLY